MGDVMKLIKTTLVLALGAFLLPSPPPGDPALQGAALTDSGADSAELALAAMRAASDVGGFCTRQPMVCETAGRAWRGLELKVKYSVRLLYEWSLKDGRAHHAAPAAPTMRNVSLPAPAAPQARPAPAPAPEAKDDSRIPARQAGIDSLITGAVTKIAARTNDDGEGGSENTLRIEDLAVPWNGPAEG